MRGRRIAGLLAAAGAVVLVAALATHREAPLPPEIPGPISLGAPRGARRAPAPSAPLPPSPPPGEEAPPGPAAAPGAEAKVPRPARPEEYLLRVVDLLTKEPVSGAVVVATPTGAPLDPDVVPPAVSGTTDRDGYVRLGLDPLAGGYLLRVTGEGRAPAEMEIGPKAGPPFGTGEIRIAMAGSIAGRVLDPAGKPVASASVYLDGSTGIYRLDRQRIAGRLGVFPDVATVSAGVRSTATGADGSFRFDGVPIGQVLIVFAAAVGCSPSSPDPRFQVPPGDGTASVDLQLRPDTSVAVRFLDAQGNGTAEPVRAWIATRLGLVPLVSTSLGIFEASSLEPGTHTLVTVPDASAFDQRTIDIPEGRREVVDVKLMEGTPLAGTVWNAVGLPIPGIAVEARGSIPGGVAAIPLRAAVTDPEGRVAFTGLSRSGAVLAVRGPDTGFLFEQGSFLPGNSTSGVNLLVPAGVRAALLPPGGLPFPPKSILRAWAGPTDRDVHMRPLDEPGNVSFDPRTGEFRVRELPAGACTLRFAVSGFAVVSRDLALPAGATTDLGTTTLAGGCTLEGSVFAPDGRGQPGVRVTAWYANGESPATWTGPDGLFRFQSLRPGPVALEFHDAVSRETRFALETRFASVDPATPPIRVDLQGGGVLLVEVRRRDGRAPMCTWVGCDPGGIPYRPIPEPLVPMEPRTWLGRRPPGLSEAVLYDPRGLPVDRVPVRIETGKTVAVTLVER